MEGGHWFGNTQGLKMPYLACLVLLIRACRNGFQPLISKVKKEKIIHMPKKKIPTFLFLLYKFMLVWFELVRVVHYGAGSEEMF